MIFKIGDKFEQTFVISEAIYQGFIAIFNDTNPLHTDEEFAIAHNFKGQVMHGNILNGFLSYFIGECLPTKNVIIHSQTIQYKRPVYLNEKLWLDVLIVNISEAVNAIEFNFTFKNADEQVVAKGHIQIGQLN